VSVRGNTSEEREQVVSIRHNITQDDVVEQSIVLEGFAGRDLELEMRVPFMGKPDHFAADVDANADFRSEGREKVTASGSNLQYARVGRNGEAIDSLDELVVCPVPSTP